MTNGAATRRALGAAAVLGAMALPAAAHATWAGRPGRIVYSDEHLHTIRSDGGGDRDLGTGGSSGVDVSPGGGEIAYFRGRSLYRIDFDGTHRRRVKAGRSSWDATEDPAWAPSGRYLSFTTLREVGDDDEGAVSTIRRVWTVRRDGTGLRTVTRGDNAAWSADGRYLLYAEDNGYIARIRPDGSGHRVLVRNRGYSSALDLSPNGRTLAYQFDPAAHGPDRVRTVDLVTGARTSFAAPAAGPRVNPVDLAWAPRGGRIAFIHWGTAKPGDYVRTIRSDGAGLRNVFRFGSAASLPVALAWQTTR